MMISTDNPELDAVVPFLGTLFWNSSFLLFTGNTAASLQSYQVASTR